MKTYSPAKILFLKAKGGKITPLKSPAYLIGGANPYKIAQSANGPKMNIDPNIHAKMATEIGNNKLITPSFLQKYGKI